MENFKIIIFILAVLLSLTAIIDKLKLPYPVLLVLIGLFIGFVPVLPDLALDPEVVFVIFLPPLIYDAAIKTSWLDFKKNIRPISTLGISLVFFTVAAVATVAHFFIPFFTWPLAFLLGAIISPPDATAATGIIRGLHLNRQVISILEGESLVNDASALIAYRYALLAVITGQFILWEAGLQFLYAAGVGIVIGLAIAWLLIQIHKRIEHYPVVETSLSLLTPFLSYLCAEWAHSSGILAVVSTGLLISWRSSEIFSYLTRMRTRIVWDTLIFLLNGFIFILIGLQLPGILKQLTRFSLAELILYGLLISFVTILVRFIWVFTISGSFHFRPKKKTANIDAEERRADSENWKNLLIVAWTGTRGVISLAAALALPLTLKAGKAFPQRPLILFLCFVVIFFTLVVQGLTLPLLVRLLKIKPTADRTQEEKELQLLVAQKTIFFIENEIDPLPDEKIRLALKNKYEHMAEQLLREIKTHQRNKRRENPLPVRVLSATQEAEMTIAKFQRDFLMQVHKDGLFSEAAIRDTERDMDINELKLNQLIPQAKNV
ncbi:MAG: Na+/H+ antiporter [Chitinophagaceae bacterium]|nr:Na+/H+ antiporter [Chitinophagaceae bacterium]